MTIVCTFGYRKPIVMMPIMHWSYTTNINGVKMSISLVLNIQKIQESKYSLHEIQNICSGESEIIAHLGNFPLIFYLLEKRDSENNI